MSAAAWVGLFPLLAMGAKPAHSAPLCPAPSPGLALFVSPERPIAGEPVRIITVAESRTDGTIIVAGPGQKNDSPAPSIRRGGPPWSFVTTIPSPIAGAYRVALVAGDKTLACRTFTVERKGARRVARAPTTQVWPITRAWDRATENLYAAWIEALFDAPPEQSLGFSSLAPAIRDPGRNFLYDHLGLREDDPKNRAAPRAEPDCADLPYYLRASFAWKLGLPFGFRDCDRGNANRPPRCGALIHNEQPARANDVMSTWKKFLRQLANKVHSGSGRTALTDEQTDYYPVALTRQALRPGVIYADPQGHVLMIVKWIDQSSASGGRLFAVDGQPDNSVGRKRFWEGTFLFANDTKSAGPGFKAFRPLAKSGDGPPVPLSNQELAKDRRFALFDGEQARLSREAFYARMAALINPQGLDVADAYAETLAALVEQLETRIGSVDIGEKYMRDNKVPVIAMPEGAKIFETVGPWEDYATPSRDMRLLIAMNVLLGLPERIVKHPELFVLGGKKPDAARVEIEKLHERRIRERTITYQRSDGSSFTTTVADLLARKSNFEMSYNPNDCVEIRWGAPDGSDEQETCNRHAPADQRAKMSQYRAWFREARRPPR